jgi:hypothetical protein
MMKVDPYWWLKAFYLVAAQPCVFCNFSAKLCIDLIIKTKNAHIAMKQTFMCDVYTVSL